MSCLVSRGVISDEKRGGKRARKRGVQEEDGFWCNHNNSCEPRCGYEGFANQIMNEL